MPPRLVLRTGMAHCFEGATFAYAVNFLHGREPRLVMLEASQDADHNLIVCRDPVTGLYGSNAQSRYPGLVGRPAEYPTIRALAESYVPFYYSDRTLDPKDLTLVGFSEPIDLAAKYGTAWMGSEAPLWDIYYTYVDDTVPFHYFVDDPGRPHLYPAVRALKENWVRLDAAGVPFVSLDDLPAAAAGGTLSGRSTMKGGLARQGQEIEQASSGSPARRPSTSTTSPSTSPPGRRPSPRPLVSR
jgi:hypothetical protein